MHYYHLKGVISGTNLDYYEYDRPKANIHLANEKRTPKNCQDNLEYQKYNLLKTKKKIINYVQSNIDLNKFITLTFKDNITSHNIANHKFDIFNTKLRKKYKDYKYIAVPEYQKRGAIHYHILTNIQYIKHKELTKIWNNGYTWINRVNHIKHLAIYISKYITKDLIKTQYKKKKFFTSQNINKPIELYNDDLLQILMTQRLKENYTYEYYMYNGYCKYKNYTLIK